MFSLPKIIIAAVFYLYAGASLAIDSFTIELGSVKNEQLEIKDLRLTWNLSGGAVLSAASMQLPEPVGRLLRPRLNCPAMSVRGATLRCRKGKLRLQAEHLPKQELPIAFEWQGKQASASVTISGMQLLSGKLDANLQWSEAKGLHAELELDGIAYSHEPLITEGLTGTATVKMQPTTKGRDRLQIDASLTAGEMLWDTWYAAVPEEGVHLLTDIRGKGDHWRIDSFSLDSDRQWQLKGEGEIDLAAEQPLQSGQLRTAGLDLAAIFADFIQPNLDGTRFADATASGRLGFSAEFAQHKLALQWDLKDATISARTNRVDLRGIESSGQWSRRLGGNATLAWQGGILWNTISVGPSKQFWRMTPESVRLDKPWRLPVMDGAIDVSALRWPLPGAEDDSIVFDGILEPISLSVLSAAFDWPPLAGKISGIIPGLRWHNRELGLNGTLLVKAFDGSILLRALSVVDPFGSYPIVRADMLLNPIDLEQLTSTFSFGRITGKLGGHVKNLVLEQWQPHEFDLLIETPAEDESRHRISQKALDQFTELGGAGVGGALSRSFLSMFDSFSYDRLGFDAQLTEGRLRLRGVEPAPNGGFYLVKGSGLPRVDVVGHNQAVDFREFVENLQNAIDNNEEIRIQ